MPDSEAAPAFEILEHTADIGLRARGRSLEELCKNAAWGLAEILDVARPAQVIGAAAVDAATPARSPSARSRGAPGGYAPRPQRIVLGQADIEALLVDWMNELILLTEDGKACLADVQVDAVGEDGLRARVELTDCGNAPEGTELKAATYHQLSVRQAADGWVAVVYFDV
ncbi:MAG TPA: archease [Actinomycetota bacterium]